MAGGIRYGMGEDETWHVSTWAFDEMLARVRRNLDASVVPELGQLLSDMDEGAQRWIILPDFPESERAAFSLAVRQAYQESVARGPAGFGTPEFFPSFLERFRELAEVLSPPAPT